MIERRVLLQNGQMVTKEPIGSMERYLLVIKVMIGRMKEGSFGWNWGNSKFSAFRSGVGLIEFHVEDTQSSKNVR